MQNSGKSLKGTKKEGKGNRETLFTEMIWGEHVGASNMGRGCRTIVFNMEQIGWGGSDSILEIKYSTDGRERPLAMTQSGRQEGGVKAGDKKKSGSLIIKSV